MSPAETTVAPAPTLSRFAEIVADVGKPEHAKAPAPKTTGRHFPGKNLHMGSIPEVTTCTAIDLDITDGCNLGCPYCFKNLDKPNNMSVETAKDAIEWLIRASGASESISVNFMGGEPTLRFKAMKEIVRWGRRRAKAAGKSVYFSFTSNMTLWDDVIRRWVDDNGLGVLMSVDGIPEMQDAQRPSKSGKPMAETVAYWAKSMLETRPGSDGRLTLTSAWVHRLYDSCVYLWDNIGFSSVMMADADYENWKEDHFAVYASELDRIVDYLSQDFRSGGLKSLGLLAYYMKFLVMPRDLRADVKRRNSPCGAGYNYNMIDHQGNIWPCHRFDGAAEDSGTEKDMRMGNIYQDDFNENLSNVFRNFDHSEIFKPACTTCKIEPVCGGFCPAANLSDMGTIYTPHDSYCRLKWIAYEKAEKLYFEIKKIDEPRCHDFLEEIVPSREA